MPKTKDGIPYVAGSATSKAAAKKNPQGKHEITFVWIELAADRSVGAMRKEVDREVVARKLPFNSGTSGRQTGLTQAGILVPMDPPQVRDECEVFRLAPHLTVESAKEMVRRGLRSGRSRRDSKAIEKKAGGLPESVVQACREALDVTRNTADEDALRQARDDLWAAILQW